MHTLSEAHELSRPEQENWPNQSIGSKWRDVCEWLVIRMQATNENPPATPTLRAKRRDGPQRPSDRSVIGVVGG